MWIVILPDEATFCKTFLLKILPTIWLPFQCVIVKKKNWLYPLEYKDIYENLLFEHFVF